MELLLQPEQVAYPHGLSIAVRGFKGDRGRKTPSQVFLEVYKGKLRVHIWNGGEDPASTTEIARVQPRSGARERTGP